MGGRTARCFLAALALAGHAVAAEPAWPLGPAAQARIEELRRVIGDAAATAAQRQAAREELVRLLMSPSATGKTVAPLPPRAAIEPASPVQPPEPSRGATLPAVTPVEPAARAPLPVPDGKGGTVVPQGKTAVDPRTGTILVDVGNGWVDPATGRFVPK
ncbi:MAG: hypothetical protein K8F93_09280 [Burkholderiales bacterium]|nr:hypothetical protein [Burkholderiales bacterium]